MKNSILRPISRLHFDNRSLSELPIDTTMNPSQRDVPNAIFALISPTPLQNPFLISYSESVAKDLLEVDLEIEPEKTTTIVSGGDTSFGRTAAHCYCGHQFGVFAGQLGDGATMYIGETVNSRGERWEFQYKGAGKTPFSRSADGRKVLRSSIREFLCSEHLYSLGVPTTRALSVCTSDSRVIRDLLYDGHPRLERCSVIIRVAESFIRFGSFEISRPTDPRTGASGPNYGKPNSSKIVKQLVDYVMRNFYNDSKSVEDFLLQVTKKTASLVALWQTFGFCHGVLNTDNMSILGKTLDYGPFGFMERFDSQFICNRSDDSGRYAYDQQPKVCLWNCLKLAETLYLNETIFSKETTTNFRDFLTLIETEFQSQYERVYRIRMRSKLGIMEGVSENEEDSLVKTFFEIMHETAADFTQTFRCLSSIDDVSTHEKRKSVFEAVISPCLGSLAMLQSITTPHYDPQQITMLIELAKNGKASEIYSSTGLSEQDLIKENKRNSRFVNISTWSEIDKKKSDESAWIQWLEKYSKFPRIVENRKSVMNSVNPRFVLRNHVAERAIEKAEKGHFDELNKVLKLCLNPYSDDDSIFRDSADGFQYDAPSPDMKMCAVSCSS